MLDELERWYMPGSLTSDVHVDATRLRPPRREDAEPARRGVGSAGPAEASHAALAVVLRARGRTWRLRASGRDAERWRDADAATLWSDAPGWHEVEAEPCEDCGEWQGVCTLCRAPARWFLDDERAEAGYLCDEHAEPYEEARERGEFGVELGLYAETEGCACDGWR